MCFVTGLNNHELDYKESWVPKNWCFWTVVLEKILESPLDCKEIQQVHPKGNQSWIFIRQDWCWSWNSNTLATWCEELIHWKRLWCWERLNVGEGDDRVGWMASTVQWTWVWVGSGSGHGQGSLACCSPWGCKELDMTERLNWTEYYLVSGGQQRDSAIHIHVFILPQIPLKIILFIL